MENKNLSTEELEKMEILMSQLEKEMLEIRDLNNKLKKIRENKDVLQKFYQDKWLNYYDAHKEFDIKFSSILNEDSLWCLLSDLDTEARNMVKNASEFL